MWLLTFIIGFVILVVLKFWPRDPPKQPSRTRSTSAGRGEAIKQKRPISIIFGSQTGTAAMCARVLHREATRLAVPSVLQDVEDFHAHTVEDETFIIFVIATQGLGDPTDTTKAFHYWLMDADRKRDELVGVKFAVFGLGDRQYKQHYCQTAIEIDKRMGELGGQRVFKLGFGDSGTDLEGDFDAWRKDLWPVVSTTLGIDLKEDTNEPVRPEYSLKVVSDGVNHPFSKSATSLEPTQRNPAYISVVSNTPLLHNSDRQTQRFVFSIASAPIAYQAGDHLGLIPCNPDATVTECIQLLEGAAPIAGQHITLVDKNNRSQFPQRVTLRTALKWYVDLCGQPKKASLRAFAHYCTNPTEKETMLRILQGNERAQEEYRAVVREARNILGIFKKFPSCRVPVGHFLEAMPPIAPRYFSISSDQLKQPKTVEATVAIIPGGLCTQMLKDLTAGAEIPAFVRKSTFHLPLRPKTRPLIMIGPGTGVAPLIGFCQRRQAWLDKQNEIGPCLFFFGCRKKSEDFLYQQELEHWVKTGVITKLLVAFSREQKEKEYVQHKLRQNADDVWRYLNDGANVYLCGDAKHMATDVEVTLLDIAVEKGGMSRTAAAEFLEKLDKDERFFKDVWSP